MLGVGRMLGVGSWEDQLFDKPKATRQVSMGWGLWKLEYLLNIQQLLWELG